MVDANQIQQLIKQLELLRTELNSVEKTSGQFNTAIENAIAGLNRFDTTGAVGDAKRFSEAISELSRAFQSLGRESSVLTELRSIDLSPTLGNRGILLPQAQEKISISTSRAEASKQAALEELATIQQAQERIAVLTEQQTAKGVVSPLLGQATERLADAERRASDKLREAELQIERLQAAAERLASGGRQSTERLSASPIDTGEQPLTQTQADEMFSVFPTADTTSKVKDFKVTMEDLQMVFKDDAAIAKFQSRLASMGFSVDKINQPIQSFSNGMRLVKLESQESEGVIRQATVRVDALGNAVDIGNTRARTFGEIIQRNIIEVGKWSIAVGVVYGTIQKLQEAIQIAIDLESELATITIALGEAHKSVATIFEDSANIAERTGQSITSVIDSYAIAVRATGNIADETERFRVANQLLTDSLALSTLTGMSTSESIDILSAAIRQMGMELEDGQQLLDLWVSTSQAANVDIETLAESFSIASATAQAFGLDAQNLNSVIAVMAESTSISATEVGNAVRRILSTIQSGATQDILSTFGISTESEGELRSFLEIMERIASLYREGILSEAQLLQIGNVAGGGARGAAGFVALVKNLDRIQEINTKTSETQGEAQKALAIQLDTTKTSVVELGNAFIEFAQALGTDGGVLEAVETLAKALSWILGQITDLTSALGEAGPALAAFGVAALVKGGGFGGIQTAITGIATQKFAGLNTEAMRRAGGIFAGVAVSGILTGINAKQGEVGAAWGNAIGGIIGATLGGVQGALIGASIGNAIGKVLLDYDADIGQALADRFKESVEENPPNLDEEANKISPDLTKEIFKVFGLGSVALGKVGAGVGAAEFNINQEIRKFAGKEDLGGIQGRITPEEFALGMLSEENLAAIMPQLLQEIIAKGFEEGNLLEGTDFAKDVKDVLARDEGKINAVIQEFKDKIDQQIIEGISGTEISDKSDAITTATAKIAQLQTAVGDKFIQASEDINTASEAYEFFAQLIIEGTPEQNQVITDLVSDIAVFSTQLEQTFSPELAEKLRNSKQELIGFLLAVQQTGVGREVDLPSIINLGDISEQQFNQVIIEAERVAENYKNALTDNLGLTEAEIEEVVNSWKPLFLRINEEFRLQEGLPQFAISEALQSVTGGAGFDIKQLDISSGQAGQLAAAYQYFDSLISSAFPQYQDNIEEFGVIFNDNVTDTLHADNLKFQLAMQQLIDIEEKQLDGIYNLPTDATFWVPWTGALVAGQRDGGATGGFGTADPNEVFSKATTSTLLGPAEREIPKWLTDTLSGGLYSDEEKEAYKYGRYPRLPVAVESYRKEPYADLIEKFMNRIDETENIPSFNLNLSINADFVTYLDTEVIGRAVTTYLEQQLVRSSGLSGGATLEYVV